MKHNLLSNIEAIKVAKRLRDIRGKKYAQMYAKIQRLFVSYFRSQSKAILTSLSNHEEMAGPQIIEKASWWEDILNVFEEDPKFRLRLCDLLAQSHRAGVQSQFKESKAEIGISYTLASKYDDEYATNRSAELMRGVSETTREEVREIFADSWKKGDSLKQISSKIQAKFTSFSSYRAALIAQQETSFAYETGKSQQFRHFADSLGVIGYKRSQTQQDSAVRLSHALNESDGWILDNENFSGTGTMMAPHGFNCRCVTSRKLMPPTPQDQLETKFNRVDVGDMSEDEQREVLKYVQSIHGALPWLPSLKKLSTTPKDTPTNMLGGYTPSTRSIEINMEYFREKGINELHGTLAHEYGHAIMDHFRRGKTQDFFGVKMKEVRDSIFEHAEALLLQEAKKDSSPYKYPIAIYFDNPPKKYYTEIESKFRRYQLTLEEVFTESVRFYFTDKKENIQNQEMQDLLHFIIPPSMKKLFKNIFKKKKEDNTFYPPFFEGGRTPEEIAEACEEDRQTRKEIEELKKQGKYVDIFEEIEKAKKTKEYRDYAGE